MAPIPSDEIWSHRGIVKYLGRFHPNGFVLRIAPLAGRLLPFVSFLLLPDDTLLLLDPSCGLFPDRTVDLEGALYEPDPALNATVFTSLEGGGAGRLCPLFDPKRPAKKGSLRYFTKRACEPSCPTDDRTILTFLLVGALLHGTNFIRANLRTLGSSFDFIRADEKIGRNFPCLEPC
jgi:hypothetical protein